MVYFYNFIVNVLEHYQKVNLAGELNKLGRIEAHDKKGIRLLHELTKIESISCPEKVARFSFNLYLLNLK